MNHRLAKPVLRGALPALLTLVACGVAPSRAPLGGNYAVADLESPRDRQAHKEDAAQPPPPEPRPAAEAPAAVKALAEHSLADVGAAAANADTLHYEPLKSGDQIKGELSVSLTAGMDTRGMAVLPGNGFVGIDAKFHVDLKVVRASVQTLDELEMTLTPISLKTEFGGHSTEVAQTEAKTFDITLGGHSPSVHERGGDKLTAEERAVLMVLVTPLSDFHEHWARSPTLELKSGWSVKVPVSVPAFMSVSSDTMRIGPFTARYTGRTAASDQVPFQITLPIQYGTDIGKLDFDLTGIAQLSSSKARPVSIDLSGPVSGGGGPHGEVSFHGSAKFAATLSYP
jgi:hypothetical protein